jgi:hypothetical protein
LEKVDMEQGVELPELPVPANRSERKKQLKHFKNLLKDHMKIKPKVDLTLTDPEAIQAQTFRVQAWGAKYGRIQMRIASLS